MFYILEKAMSKTDLLFEVLRQNNEILFHGTSTISFFWETYTKNTIFLLV